MSSLKLLLVDGDDSIRVSLSRGLRNAGFQVTECIDGDEALARIGKETPDLVLLDVVLAKVDGIEVARRVRERRVPVVFLSTLADGETVMAALEQGGGVTLSNRSVSRTCCRAFALRAYGRPNAARWPYGAPACRWT